MTMEQFERFRLYYQQTKNEPNELKEYRVDNAIILAADGLTTTHETIYAPPKGLLKVGDVPVIERQICQLIEAGINEIYVVVGYKKEMYFYLEDKYNVHLIGNPRLDKNNIYSLYLAKDKLKNSYVCASDYYYEENPFSSHELCAYHTTAYIKNASRKFIVSTNSKGRILGLTAGGNEGESIHGMAYFDRKFSETFVALMEREIDRYRVDSLFWEEFFAEYIDELDLYIKHVDADKVKEFDDLNDLKSLNVLFVNSVNLKITENICEQLECSYDEISSVDILEAGHSNITFKVVVKNNVYVYRYPGISGKNIVSRARETFANTLAKELDIDKTLIFIDSSGHKLSRFVPDAHPLNREDKKELAVLAQQVKRLHDYKVYDNLAEQYSFEPIAEADRLLNLACNNKDNLFEIFKDMRNAVLNINAELEKDIFPKAICHCNLNSNNCLVTDTGFDLIDWEFSGYCDIAYDFPFLGDYEFKLEDLKTYLEFYYQRTPTEAEFKHWLWYRAVHYWYYVCWAIYKESLGEDCGNLLVVFYENCKKIIKLVKHN